jgi:hypothetical protein
LVVMNNWKDEYEILIKFILFMEYIFCFVFVCIYIYM